jgi:hypothetical protein
MTLYAGADRLSNVLREALAAADRIGQHERVVASARSERAIWNDFGQETTDYADTFRAFLGVQSFEAFLRNERSHFDTFAALDLAAPTRSFLTKHPTLTAGIAVTLTDTRTPEQIEKDATQQFYTVEGSLLRRSTWRALRAQMARASISGFALIVCRPYAGMVDHDLWLARLYRPLLDRTVRLLMQGGILMTELPTLPDFDYAELPYQLNAGGYSAVLLAPDSGRQHYAQRPTLIVRAV